MLVLSNLARASRNSSESSQEGAGMKREEGVGGSQDVEVQIPVTF